MDLNAYMERIGLEASIEPTRELLVAMHRAHVMSIPFENIDVLVGRTPSLHLNDIFGKLVQRRRGGYCYEHNLLLAAALERVGFQVERLLARVYKSSDEIAPRTHMLLRVTLPESDDEQVWLADAGLGVLRPLDPLPWRDGAVSQQHGWRYRLEVEANGVWRLHLHEAEGWRELYRFALETQHPADYEMSNYYTATHPGSPFVSRLLVANVSPQRRMLLRDMQLTEFTDADHKKTWSIRPEGLNVCLAEYFGMTLSDVELDALRKQLEMKQLATDQKSEGIQSG
ncbi:arylamine N-acetyltransferase [Phycisphaerales bacterium AB-hyl4]|uniref:Arylamine N-acetyltransferase n=1 Tax=Natronomicrosphaera hydrolytica TaxID=3242702 RepID=A0ABV4U415_9BACT